jgi:hypothetical protein
MLHFDFHIDPSPSCAFSESCRIIVSRPPSHAGAKHQVGVGDISGSVAGAERIILIDGPAVDAGRRGGMWCAVCVHEVTLLYHIPLVRYLFKWSSRISVCPRVMFLSPGEAHCQFLPSAPCVELFPSYSMNMDVRCSKLGRRGCRAHGVCCPTLFPLCPCSILQV